MKGVTLTDVRAVALPLPRTSEHLIRDVVKFRVGSIVYAAVSPDEVTMGFGFPKEEREAIIDAEPEKLAELKRRLDTQVVIRPNDFQ